MQFFVGSVGRMTAGVLLGAAMLMPGWLSAAPHRIDAIHSLGLKFVPGSLPAFYSPHAQARAKYLQGLLGGEIAYYAAEFHFAFGRVALAVLNDSQWPKVAGEEPYGMPSVDGTKPAVIVMPASWDDVTWMAVPKREEVPMAMLQDALAGGKHWEQVKFEGCDGIGTHEVGHFIVRQLGIDPQTYWFSEFLASYAGYAYLKAKQPGQALSNEIFWTVGLKNSPHPFTRLEDFESKYDELQQQYPGNYGWYQLALDQRVIEIYEQSGIRFLHEVREKFPAGAPALDSAQLLNKLESLNPGWKAWALRLEAGEVTATPIAVADAPSDPRAEVAAALKGMGDAANAHDVERHVGYYAHTPNVTLIYDGEPLIGWETIRDKQKEWWNNGQTDVVYEIQGPPDVVELAPTVVVTTLLMKAHRTTASGEVKEGRFAVTSIWQKRPEGWKVVYSHESTTR